LPEAKHRRRDGVNYYSAIAELFFRLSGIYYEVQCLCSRPAPFAAALISLRKNRRQGKVAPKIGVEKVISSARSLMRQPRSPQITRAEVAKAAGVDQKLVRYYFENYEDLLDQVMDMDIAELEATMVRASQPQKMAAAILRNRLTAMVTFLADNPTFFKSLLDRVYEAKTTKARERLEALNKRAYERHRKMIASGRENGEFRQDFDPRLLYIAIIGMTEFFSTGKPVVEYIFQDKAENVQRKYEKFLLELIVRGIKA